ncbi:hypothetical protein B0I33_11485 [Prauserella shujinwangii]|uniref:Succinate-acetate transporter protein n=1 Tax=Prauserella shujinwangii TaxID=1453103 RepID=A0A2T0LL58_9PSEU|nr:GPR1/FUN34/YaaH family transporter [Prauserella shujinwangii]PRX43624.1 hypothetical protein B0I33_11485 [Prauserella shujinwangii]
MARSADRNAEHEGGFWRDRTRIVLTPVAAPSILGLFGFAASAFAVSANVVGWYGVRSVTPLVLAAFVLTFGGVAQVLAAMWAYRARDAVATAMHGAWGSYWIGYGLYHLLIAAAVLPAPTADAVARTAFGFWFVGLAAITVIGSAAAAAENLGIALELLGRTCGATLLAIGLIAGVPAARTAGGYALIVAAVLACYTASGLLLEAATQRVVLPVGKRGAEPDTPGARPRRIVQYPAGEPGVRYGQ